MWYIFLYKGLFCSSCMQWLNEDVLLMYVASWKLKARRIV